MDENREQIERLETRLDRLVRTQIDFQKEVSAIRAELERLRVQPHLRTYGVPPEPSGEKPPVRTEQPPAVHESKPPPVAARAPTQTIPPPKFGSYADQEKAAPKPAGAFSTYVSDRSEAARTDLEKFIGENLISKIGILVLIIGVGIGVKYAIDNGWISPLMRVVFGYVVGVVLVGLAAKLKAKYHNFSAVLLSGGIAILYFVTYFAYAYYSLIGQPLAFALMVLLTVATVAAAIFYDRQVIAHIGLVGAYGVPFLLSNRSGNYVFLFTYMAVVNTGILAISLKKYWKPLVYTASVFTWIIFGAWVATKYYAEQHFHLALIFLAVFFGLFYAAKIAHTYLTEGKRSLEDTISVFATTFIFYAFCLALGDLKTSVAEYAIFFSYLAAISLLVLVSSYRFFSHAIVYLSYPFTWLIFAAWFFDRYRAEEHFALAAVFAGVFFAIYYVTTLVYRLVGEKIGMIENSGLVLTNSFLFYGFGYAIMDSRANLEQYQGLFTVAHAALHSAVAQAVGRLRSTATDVVQVLTILIITFATIAIPVQFDGNRITLIWAVEAAVLFWFGRVKQIRLFEFFSYAIMALATLSLLLNWATSFGERTDHVSELNLRPIVNGDFLTALVFVAAFAFICWIDRRGDREPAVPEEISKLLRIVIPAVALAALYNAFRTEISNYFHLRTVESRASLAEFGAFATNRDLDLFNILWQIDYTMLFLSLIAFVNVKWVRSKTLAYANVALAVIAISFFVSIGMMLLYELRLSYMDPAAVQLWGSGPMNVAIRYVSYLVAAILMGWLYRYSRDVLLDDFVPPATRAIAFEAFLYSILLIVLSCDLVNVMTQFGIADSTKLGLSILWVAYALFLVVLGIARNKKYLRFAAIALIGVTLAKLFFYDIADLPTIPKTILFISIGAVLLVVSFLYNKYKSRIFTAAEAGAPAEDEKL
ncbi:MAG: DUF2339 domain-containing protein [Pyrinomonadaceae bacterium]